MEMKISGIIIEDSLQDKIPVKINYIGEGEHWLPRISVTVYVEKNSNSTIENIQRTALGAAEKLFSKMATRNS